MVVITIIASSVLLLSVAIVSAADHAFDQISLALPIFFILLLLATSIGEWLELEDCFIESKPRLSIIRTRAPPA
jgi:hypothetical protein